MQDFIYSYDTKVFSGKGSVEKNLKDAISVLGDKILLTYGGASAVKTGSLDRVSSILKNAGKEIVLFSGIMPNPTWNKVKEGALLAKKENVNGILALGGGSVIDASKIIALQAVTDEDIWDLEINKKSASKAKALPLGAIVTATGTGSEMNGGAVITNEDVNLKSGLFAAAPRFAFLDYEYYKTVPRRQVLSGAFDTLSHAVETYFGSSSLLNPSDDIALSVMKNTVKNIRVIIDDYLDEEARSNLAWDSAMAENGILKIGRKTDFQVHMMEHQLGAYTDCNHGEGLAVLQPIYMRHVYKNVLNKSARFARTVFDIVEKDDEKAAILGIESLEKLISDMSLPRRLWDLKMKDDQEKLLTNENLKRIAESTVIIKTGAKELSKEEILEIFKEAL